MGVFIIAGIIAAVAILALMFSRGGAREPASFIPSSASRPRFQDRAELEMLTLRALQRWGLRTERVDDSEKQSFGVLAVDPTPITGGRVYLCTFTLAPEERATESQVQAQLDGARDEGVSKLILISPNGFSESAILAARDTIALLIDGPTFAKLLEEPASGASLDQLRAAAAARSSA